MIWLLFFCIQLRRHGTKHSSCFHFSVHHNHRSKQQAMTEIDKSFLDNVSIKVIFVKILSVCIPISPRLCEYLPPWCYCRCENVSVSSCWPVQAELLAWYCCVVHGIPVVWPEKKWLIVSLVQWAVSKAHTKLNGMEYSNLLYTCKSPCTLRLQQFYGLGRVLILF